MTMMNKVVWLAVLWIALLVMFPDIGNTLPPPIVTSLSIVSAGVIVTGREHLLSFAYMVIMALFSPIYLLYKWLFE